MKRGKRFLEKENLFVYIGTAVFFMLAIALGIIMYMMSRTRAKIEKNLGQSSQEIQIEHNTEPVTTDIGKTVEEQKNNENDSEKKDTSEVGKSEDVNTKEEKSKVNASKTSNVKNTTKTKTVDEPDTTTNAPTQKEVEEPKKEVTFVKPAEGEIICEYAKDNLIYSETLKEWITHTAIDIKADKTSVIKTAADGVVKSIINDPRYGLTIIVSHDDGFETVYSNLLTAEFVVEGEEVAQGQTIATVGSTASFESSMECHLHFEILKDGEAVDPAIYLK